jgi:hypothetical protein
VPLKTSLFETFPAIAKPWRRQRSGMSESQASQRKQALAMLELMLADDFIIKR